MKISKRKLIFNFFILQLFFLIALNQDLSAKGVIKVLGKSFVSYDLERNGVFSKERAGEFTCKTIMNCGMTAYKKQDTIKKDFAIVKSQLEIIYDDDQKYRKIFENLNDQVNSAQRDSVAKLMKRQDSVNLSKIQDIINKFGWLGPDQVGEKASLAFFFVMQHADLEVQQKYLPILEQAAAEKKAKVWNIAYLIDRIEMRTGKPQTYGTQTTFLDNETFVYPIRDVSNVNKRRKKVGLSPIEESFNGQNVKFSLAPLTRVEEKSRDYLLNALNDLSTENQKNIRDYLGILRKYGKNSQEELAQRNIKQNHTAILLIKIQAILDNYGWPGYSTIGMPGSIAIFSILSAADAKTIEKYLPMLKATVARGEASPGHLAFLEDKIAVASGRPQIYGTQINGEKKPYPIENEKEVDERRLKIGLTPLKDYLKRTYGVEYAPSK